MKKPSGPRKTANLSELTNRQLRMYAIAAGAAGVSVLALASPTLAKIVYTPTHHKIGPNNHYTLDLNHDRLGDFKILNAYGCNFDYCYDYVSAVPARRGNHVEGNGGTQFVPHCAYALKSGSPINGSQPFSGIWMARLPSQFCDWFNVNDRYLGFKFQIGAKTHYGWARLNARLQGSKITLVLTGYAYETVAGKAIKAGQTKEVVDDRTNEDFGFGATPDTPQPASLGMLAMGSQGLSVWRREGSADTMQYAALVKEDL
jgi:hypothetical protein